MPAGVPQAAGTAEPAPAFPSLTPIARTVAGTGSVSAPGYGPAPGGEAGAVPASGGPHGRQSQPTQPGQAGRQPAPDATAGPLGGEAGAPPDPREATALDAPAGVDDPTLVICSGAGVVDEYGRTDRNAAAGSPPAGGAPGAAPADGTPGAGAPRQCAECRAGAIDDDGYCENCGHAQPRERDHMEEELAFVAAASDRGLRHRRNEDSFALSEAELPDGSPAVVAVVCDGVSSATRPDDASAAAARVAGERLLTALPLGTHPQQAMHEAIVAAADAVNALAREPGPARQAPQRHENAPACTIVSAIIASGILTVGWIGDSRAYWVPDDRATPAARLTEDDSWAAQMVAAGLLSEAEAYADERAHAITGWLGADAYEIEPHTAAFKPDRPGVVVVCTDGLWNYAESAPEMAAAVPSDARARPMDSARTLVGYALEGGGHDNVTVAVLPFPVPPGRAGSA
ncbi:protein phosphatase 2C domain-containing protein [Streptomyces zagrosensis]|uniref:Serine/threonine protein phosphatase PrpC n=2 Tax=Streptomyces zagrosensis TaxID=1042984 RepID=A0A7W9UXJ9_9ACTN|nr:serine/threonine protein phosphatase PrpC [Streptomyces zagrosensis]